MGIWRQYQNEPAVDVRAVARGDARIHEPYLQQPVSAVSVPRGLVVDDASKSKQPEGLPQSDQTAARGIETAQDAPRKGCGGRPRKGSEHFANVHLKPWVSEGLSERTWYRRKADKGREK